MSDGLEYTVIDGVRCFSPEVAKSYSDYPDAGFDLTDEGADSSFWVRSRNRLFKRIVKKNVRASGKTRFLEIGCGTGDFIKHIVDIDDLDITGSEIYLKGLLYAKKSLPNVEFIQFDVTQGTINQQFDLIVAFDVIEHIDDDVAAITNINRMLTDQGTVVLSVPQHMFLWSRLDEIVKHKRRYARPDLLAKLQSNGFDVRYCSSFVFTLFPLMLVSRMLDKRHGPTQSDEVALKKRVKFSPALNWIMDHLMRVDEWLIGCGLSLPVGGTLLVVARKRQ